MPVFNVIKNNKNQQTNQPLGLKLRFSHLQSKRFSDWLPPPPIFPLVCSSAPKFRFRSPVLGLQVHALASLPPYPRGPLQPAGSRAHLTAERLLPGMLQRVHLERHTALEGLPTGLTGEGHVLGVGCGRVLAVTSPGHLPEPPFPDPPSGSPAPHFLEGGVILNSTAHPR